MSGHSKWSTIKHQKGANDAKRAKVFTRLLRGIQLAVREGGSDPEKNAALRTAIERAKAQNVPKDTIERALTKNDAKELVEVAFDAIGPGGTQMIIECATNNRNRTVAEIRHLLEKQGAKVGQEGSARWAFSRRGLVFVDPAGADADDVALALVEAGADDVVEDGTTLLGLTKPEQLAQISTAARDAGLAVSDAALGWHPAQTVTLHDADAERLQSLISAIEDHDDVQSVWVNAV
jgi:YebC/PmpR family DNA-binding regulatory protein